ncbi:hypothetical protein HMPREF0693_1575 [Proteus mirabilis ATCC 29906]|nr:hypothetical protein HMPREF0693_1575 [Proteus mirabilis ATCC 29906]KXB99473.1 hypothetical protein HMPREF3203_03047 [Proteus mirabilis]PVF83641.1 hypothetical protein CSC14_3082 [Proteus mirabilis]
MSIDSLFYQLLSASAKLASVIFTLTADNIYKIGLVKIIS